MREAILSRSAFRTTALAAAIVAGAGVMAAAQDFTWEGRVAPGQAVEIKGINGDVKAPAAGDRVEVVAVKKARRSDPASVQIKVVEHAGGVTICAVYSSTAGRAEAETVNGSITATVGRADGTEPLTFKTVNGSIALDLPSGANAEVRAATVNGDIQTDFPLQGQVRVSRRRLVGTIGVGGRELALETVNGSIRIRQAR